MRMNKGLIGLALVAALALMVATVGASASASGGSAVAAKKKCKKKKAHSAKKKKCKKNGTGTTTPPITMLRATLTWTGGGGNTDYDLYVFDPSGATGRAASNPIPKSSFSPNVLGTSGSETFTDLDFGAHRAFAFGVCHQDGGNDGSSYSIEYVSASGVHFTDSQAGTGDGYNARYSIDYVSASGVHFTDSQSGNSDGYNARYSDSGGAPATNTFTCPVH